MASLTSLAAAIPWMSIFFLYFMSSAQAFNYSEEPTYYWPNGDVATDTYPCYADGGGCCPENWACFTGLCMNQDAIERFSCADRTWTDTRCAHVCDYDDTSHTYESVRLCGDEDDGSWCCNGSSFGNQCCSKHPPQMFSHRIGGEVYLVSVAQSTTTRTMSTGSPTLTSPEPTSSSQRPTSSSSELDSTTAEILSATITSTNADGQISTMVSISVVIVTAAPATYPTNSATTTPTPTTAAESVSSGHIDTIVGTTVGIPLGLFAIALLFYVLRRRPKQKAINTPTPNPDVYIPPSPMVHTDSMVFEKAELEALPNTRLEVPRRNTYSELESPPRVTSSPDNRVSFLSEYGQSPSAVSNRSNRVSAMSTADMNRWSAVSSLAPQSVPHRASTGSPPMAVGLQIFSQQHYGSEQSSFATEDSSYRLTRPPSGPLPVIQVSGSEITLSPTPALPGSGEQSDNAQQNEQFQEAHEGEAVQDSQGGEGLH